MQNDSQRAFVALGTNVPFEGASGAALLTRALAAMAADGLDIRVCSGVWQTESWPPGSAQADYFNAVVELAVEGGPQDLYAALQRIEARFGRSRREQWAPRTLDLDIVAMDGWEGTFGALTLPHARMQERAFVLAPLAEIAPGWRHPRLGRTAAELLADLPAGYRYRRVGNFSGLG